MRVRRTPNPPRRGVAQVLETAIVLPVVMMLTLGTCSTAMGVYYYQLVATLAREGARWASVHGPTYQAEHTANAPTSQDVYNNAILPMAVGLTPAQLTCVLTMTSNTATVTVTYPWTPDLYITGPLNLTSTSVMPITY